VFKAQAQAMCKAQAQAMCKAQAQAMCKAQAQANTGTSVNRRQQASLGVTRYH